MKTYKVTIDEYGTIRWYNAQDQLHRDEGPAVEYASGTKYWFQNGQYHRLDGPAVEWVNGDKSWYIKDQELTEAAFLQRTKGCEGQTVTSEGQTVTINGQTYKLVKQ